MAVLRVEHVSQAYQTKDGEVTALKDIDFAMERGDFFSIVGPSGVEVL